MTLLFVFMCKFPDRVFLLRGNHEFADVCAQYGFKHDILRNYTESLFDAFMSAFSFMPLAAIVNNAIFCVHGGIGPSVTAIAEIEKLQRPIVSDRDHVMVRTMVWADPVTQNVKYGRGTRSDIATYGMIAVREFLRDNGLILIIRAHQCVNGVRIATGFPVITVFSASNYKANPPNDAGVLSIHVNGQLEKLTFPPIIRIPRETASFFSLGWSPHPAEEDTQEERWPLRSVPSAVLSEVALIGLGRPLRSLARNSVAALLVPRKLLPTKKVAPQASSFVDRLSVDLTDELL
jgi:diadenosine tetraphosphatase ApaH/serine/threonine PP2A family protein phosphatase